MDKNRIFLILGIGETKDKAQIKQAYYKKLVHVKPEEDPEGFKELRGAYEAAVYLAEKENLQNKDLQINQENGTVSEASVDTWMGKVEETYQALSLRIQTESWRALFMEETALDLVDGERCKRRFFQFLTGHFRLPSEVWEYLDGRLNIREERRELTEYLPGDFVDYMVYHCRHKDWFPYQLFEGDDRGDYDTFITLFFEITRKLDTGDTSEIEKLIAQAEALPVSHPYLDLEKIRFFQIKGESQQAQTLLEQWREAIKEDKRYQYIGSQVFWEAGDYERAREFCEQILRRDKTHFTSNKHMGRYWFLAGDYDKAKEYTIEAVRVSQDKELKELLHDINRELIPRLQSELTKHPQDGGPLLKLGWCYLQNDKIDAGISLIQEYSPKEEEEEEYHNLLGKLYVAREAYAQAKFHIRRWIEYLEAHTEFNSAKEEGESKRLRDRLSNAHNILAGIYRCLAGKPDTSQEEKQELYKMALKELDLAGGFGEDLTRSLLDKAALYMDMGEYGLCIDACTAIEEQEIRYFPAIALRQEAFARRKDFRGVIRDFYAAYALFTGYAKMYELAAEACYESGNLSGLEEIIGLADKNGQKSLLLDLYRGRVRRLSASSTGEISKLILYLYQIKDEYEKEGIPNDKLAQLLCELAVCFDILHKETETQTLLDAAIEADGSKPQYRFLKGDILYSNQQYQQALLVYQDCLKTCGEYARLYVGAGDCHSRLGRKEEALTAYQKALLINPAHEDANGKIVEVYTDLLKEEEDIRYYHLALPFADRQVQLHNHEEALVQMGRLHMEAGFWEEASASLKEVLKQKPENIEAHLLMSYVHKFQWQLQPALKEALKSIGLLEGQITETDLRLFWNLADIYCRLGEYQKAVDICIENIDRFPKVKKTYLLLGEIYKRQGQVEKARTVLGKALGYGGELQREIGHLYLTGSGGNAGRQYLLAYRQGAMTKTEYHYYRALAHCLKGQYFLGAVHIRLAQKAGNPGKSDLELFRLFMLLFENKKQVGFVKRYAGGCLDDYKKQYGSLEKFPNSLYTQAFHNYQAGCLYLYLGDLKKAEECFHQMDAVPRCRGCSYQECWHRLLAKALCCERNGNREEALKLYERGYHIARDAKEACLYYYRKVILS